MMTPHEVMLSVVILMSLITTVISDHIFYDVEGWQRGKVIDGDPIMKRLTRNVYQCSALCRMTKSCISFSYDVKSKSCTVLSSSVENSTLNIQRVSVVNRNITNSKISDIIWSCDNRPCSYGTVCLNVGTSHTCVSENERGLFSHEYLCKSRPGFSWSRTSGICYKLNASMLTHQTATAMCEQDGGHLVTIDSLKKQQTIVDIILSDPAVNSLSRFWIGAEDSLVEDEWRWTDGSLVQFSYWMSNKPNGGKVDEDYVAMEKAFSYKWNDFRPIQQYASVCEITL